MSYFVSDQELIKKRDKADDEDGRRRCRKCHQPTETRVTTNYRLAFRGSSYHSFFAVRLKTLNFKKGSNIRYHKYQNDTVETSFQFSIVVYEIALPSFGPQINQSTRLARPSKIHPLPPPIGMEFLLGFTCCLCTSDQNHFPTTDDEHLQLRKQVEIKYIFSVTLFDWPLCYGKIDQSNDAFISIRIGF